MANKLSKRIGLYLTLMRINRPIGIFLLLWPTLWAIWIASHGHPNQTILMIFIGGTILMRSAGCVINDYVDRDIDGYIRRTANRPLASKQIIPKKALYLALLLIFCAFLLVLYLNALTRTIAIIALFFAISYPWMKRFMIMPQAYLGITFGFGILMAFSAIQNKVPLTAWLLFIANAFWVLGYDTEYAMADREDDIKIGIRTSAITFGNYDKAAIMTCHCCFIGLLLIIGNRLNLGWEYFGALIGATLLIIYQYAMIYNRDPQRCFQAFLQNNWIGLIIFIGIVTDYLTIS